MGTLTEREFRVLLRRAAASAESKPFSDEELFEAGAEIGIERAVVQSLLYKHRQLAIRPRQPKPARSTIDIDETADSLSVYISRIGNRKPTSAIVAATLVTLLIVGSWTFVALRHHQDIVIFTIPAWCGVIIGLFVSAVLCFERTKLVLRDGHGEIHRSYGPITRKETFRLDDVRLNWNDGSGTMLRGRAELFPFVDMHIGTARHKLMFGFSRPEQDWVISELQRWIEENS